MEVEEQRKRQMEAEVERKRQVEAEEKSKQERILILLSQPKVIVCHFSFIIFLTKISFYLS